MTTNQPPDEGFDNAVRAVMRPTGPPSSPSGKLRVVNLYCGTGALSQAAIEVGMELVYAHDPVRKSQATYARKFGLEPDGNELPDFSTVPAFDILLGTLPKENVEVALAFVLRYLRVRRPDTFVLVGHADADEQGLTVLVREKTQGLGYEIASGGNTLLGVYEARAEEEPLVVGMHYLYPIHLSVLADARSGGAPVDDGSMIKAVLERIVQAFPPNPPKPDTGSDVEGESS